MPSYHQTDLRQAAALFAHEAVSICVAIIHPSTVIRNESKTLPGSDRLQAQERIDRLENELLCLMIFAKRVEQGLLPR